MSPPRERLCYALHASNGVRCSRPEGHGGDHVAVVAWTFDQMTTEGLEARVAAAISARLPASLNAAEVAADAVRVIFPNRRTVVSR